MKSHKIKVSNSKYPDDYKDVFKNYLLKNAVIEKYNRDNILNGKQHE